MTNALASRLSRVQASSFRFCWVDTAQGSLFSVCFCRVGVLPLPNSCIYRTAQKQLEKDVQHKMAYDDLRLSNNVSILVELSNYVWITAIRSIFATIRC